MHDDSSIEDSIELKIVLKIWFSWIYVQSWILLVLTYIVWSVETEAQNKNIQAIPSLFKKRKK